MNDTSFDADGRARRLTEVVALATARIPVITSYSIHYTKLYDPPPSAGSFPR